MTYTELLTTAQEIAKGKAEDYSHTSDRHSNFKFASDIASEFDSVSFPYVTLISIKLARLQVLLNSGKEPNNESITDTFIDLINYIALWGDRITEGK